MSKGKVTIKEIAELAGVSIATVSHVINRTRYVRPELVDKIEKIIVETGYQNKIADKERKLLVGRESTIVAVIPNIESTIYRDMVAYVKQLVSVQGYQFLVAITDNDLKEEAQVLAGLLVNKKVAGIIHAPVSDVASNYTKLIQSGVPFVCVERNILGSGIDSVEFRDREAIFKGADYLLASGHKNVLFFRESTDSTTRDERTKGFLNALEKYNINTNDANIVDVTLEKGEDDCMLAIQKALRRYRPTAVLAGGNRITLYLMKTLRDMGIDCPGEISVVGFGDESWSELTYPPLTILRRDVKGLSAKAVGMLFEKINTDFSRIKLHDKRKQRVGIVGELYIKYCHLGNWDMIKFLESNGCESHTNGLSWYAMYYMDSHLTDNMTFESLLYKVGLKFFGSLQRAMIEALRKYGFYTMEDFFTMKREADGYVSWGYKTGDGWLIGAEITGHILHECPKVLAVQPFGCMPNHTCGRGLYPSLQKKLPQGMIVSCDMDSSGSKLNVYNRARMLVDMPLKMGK